ncbi:MAG: alanine-zipper protein [Defluviicoccus sp.]|nr:alanine-zipper protein [Defluviicoccus sp.]
MKALKTCAVVALPLMFVAGCEVVTVEQHRSTDAIAKQAAAAAAAAGAKADAAGKRAEDAARAAERAAAAAERAANEAKSASMKMDRMMQSKMRK